MRGTSIRATGKPNELALAGIHVHVRARCHAGLTVVWLRRPAGPVQCLTRTFCQVTVPSVSAGKYNVYAEVRPFKSQKQRRLFTQS